MLFNSYEYIFFFLPVVLIFFYKIGGYSPERSVQFLVLASLFFYGWWNPSYLILIATSIVVNFLFGELLAGKLKVKFISRKVVLLIGVLFNLGLIGYFKYSGFFEGNYHYLTGGTYLVTSVILPLAISFFTFQQIAYLVDAYDGLTHEYKFSHYALFVTYFPQLIAGPIVHHKEMLSQFDSPDTYRFNLNNVATGITIFSIGLFKKTVIADNLSPYVAMVFDQPELSNITLFEA